MKIEVLHYDFMKTFYCFKNWKTCARFFLKNDSHCDCVDDLLQPNEIEKAKLILQIEKMYS